MIKELRETSHADAISELISRSNKGASFLFIKNKTPYDMAEHIMKDKVIALTSEMGDIVSFIILSQDGYGEETTPDGILDKIAPSDRWYLKCAFTDREYRNIGCYKKLLTFASKKYNLFLRVDPRNMPSLAVSFSCGLKSIGMFFLDVDEPRLVFVKD